MPKLPPPPPAGPEQVGLVSYVRPRQVAVGGDNTDGLQVVGGGAEGARGEPDAAAQRKPSQPHGRARPGGDGQPAGGQRGHQVDHVASGAGGHAAAVGGDRDRAQQPQVTDETAAGRVAGVTVAARARCQRAAGRCRVAHTRLHVGLGRHRCHRLRMCTVVAGVVHGAGGRVSGLAGFQQLAVQVCAELAQSGSPVAAVRRCRRRRRGRRTCGQRAGQRQRRRPSQKRAPVHSRIVAGGPAGPRFQPLRVPERSAMGCSELIPLLCRNRRGHPAEGRG